MKLNRNTKKNTIVKKLTRNKNDLLTARVAVDRLNKEQLSLKQAARIKRQLDTVVVIRKVYN